MQVYEKSNDGNGERGKRMSDRRKRSREWHVRKIITSMNMREEWMFRRRKFWGEWWVNDTRVHRLPGKKVSLLETISPYGDIHGGRESVRKGTKGERDLWHEGKGRGVLWRVKSVRKWMRLEFFTSSLLFLSFLWLRSPSLSLPIPFSLFEQEVLLNDRLTISFFIENLLLSLLVKTHDNGHLKSFILLFLLNLNTTPYRWETHFLFTLWFHAPSSTWSFCFLVWDKLSLVLFDIRVLSGQLNGALLRSWYSLSLHPKPGKWKN